MTQNKHAAGNRFNWWRSLWLLALASSMFGQPGEEAIASKILPGGALIVESSDISGIAKRKRIMVLWMQNARRQPRQGYCGDSIYGDHWVGEAKLSLIDPLQRKVLQTIPIREASATATDGSFKIPFRAGSHYYHVTKMDEKGEGQPSLLQLRDLTGDGIAAEFALFTFQACGIVLSSAFGYRPASDSILQFPVEVIESGKRPRRETWVPQIFAMRPNGKGTWDFKWEPGHGSSEEFREMVHFDEARVQFINRSIRKAR